MHLEHCTSYGHDITFTTPNYHITTTPEKEWGIVVLGKRPEEKDMGHGRTILDLAHARHWPSDDLILSERDDPMGTADERKRADLERKLCAAQLVTDAKLQQSELAAVILYTGPMVGKIPS